ncbi:DUF3139 domain-containing protein [Bacillus sp. FJAT-50079]|uniref:YfjL-like protein n=1 Tax=Bacillus sp. FJAT-50079 TaxID=2833577 RepID=UPI001BC8DEBE|nr:DUF3139 domain-containing protein [Bacillus sp. FJAT-50079]MBS4206929.1 DUF3139 domain-containing protein [Bacillus sp. FJAT-50079]
MKKKKWLYIGLLIILIVPIIFLYQSFNGNPLTKYMSKSAVKRYLSENYPEHEYHIRKDVYNFKISGYSYEVVQIGSEENYEFEVTGLIKPTVTYDGIYYANLDMPLIEKLQEQAAAELTTLLQEPIPELTNLSVQLEVLKGTYDEATNWHKDLKIEKPLYIHMTMDVAELTKEDVLTAAKTAQKILNDEGYSYSRVSLNGNMFDLAADKDNPGYVKYAVGFEPNTNIALKQIEDF